MKQLTQSEFKKNGKIYKNISSPAPSGTQNQITDLIDDNGVLKQSTDGGSTFIEVETKQGYEAVKFTPQTLTEAEKLQARQNIGAGSAKIIDYNDTINKPILKTNNTTSQTPNASETIENTINLHKISKTGALADSIQDSTHRTVSDTEKADWNNTNFSRLTNVPKASTSTAGIIQIATDIEAENGTNETKAINPKQLVLLKSTVTDLTNNKVNKTVTFNGFTVKIDMLESGGQLSLSCYDGFDENLFEVASTYTRSVKPLYIENDSEDNKVIIKSELQTADSQNVKLTGDQSIGGVKDFTGTLKIVGKDAVSIEEIGEGYIRYSDGTQICHGREITPTTGANSITFPKPFIETPSVCGTFEGVESTQNYYSFIIKRSLTTTGFEIKGFKNEYCDYIAIGKWK